MKSPVSRKVMKRLRYIIHKTVEEELGCKVLYFTLKENPGADESEVIVHYFVGTKPILHNMKYNPSNMSLEGLCDFIEHSIKEKIEQYKCCVINLKTRGEMYDKSKRKSN